MAGDVISGRFKRAFGYSRVILASPKVLPLGKENKNFVVCFAFRSLMRDFGSAESTLARKSSNKIWLFAHLCVLLQKH